MGLWEKIKFAFEDRDVFRCDHCKRKSKGRYCPHCIEKVPRGWYTDEHGGLCKPTARIPATAIKTMR